MDVKVQQQQQSQQTGQQQQQTGQHQQQQQQQNNNNQSNRCNLIVNYLPQSVKEHDFNALFSKIGAVKSCRLMFDRQTGKYKKNILFL